MTIPAPDPPAATPERFSAFAPFAHGDFTIYQVARILLILAGQFVILALQWLALWKSLDRYRDDLATQELKVMRRIRKAAARRHRPAAKRRCRDRHEEDYGCG